MTHLFRCSMHVAAILTLASVACDRSDAPPREEPPPGATVRLQPVDTAGGTGAAGATGLREAISPRIHFAFDNSTIRTDAAAVLDRKAQALQANPAARIRVAGHCDERGAEAYNQALGRRRAEAAKQYLVRAGIAAGRIEVVTFGESRPLETGRTPQAWAANRRAEFELLSSGGGTR